jgi:glutaredoxin
MIKFIVVESSRSPSCRFCAKAKAILKNNNETFTNFTCPEKERNLLLQIISKYKHTKNLTFPQIFCFDKNLDVTTIGDINKNINDLNYIGGYEQLEQKFEK